ncbi:hypothetical protein [Mucilaginibacter antarcticus]|uniref:hypothetical protein n=1 Tax=Mucilaginibacter antarcticus TaxID=1855725 RepID=UPI0036298678
MYACTKSTTDGTPTPTPLTTVGNGSGNSIVFYTDTFRVYSTNLAGGDRKLVVDEDLKSQNNYIGLITAIPGKNKIAYTYTTGGSSGFVIKTADTDGKNIKTIKTMPASNFLGYMKGMSDGRIYFSYGPVGAPGKNYVMDADGANETQLSTIPPNGRIEARQISTSGKGIIDESGYFMVLNNGVFAEASSFYLLANETKTTIRQTAVSDDATKLAILYTTANPNVFELRVKDITKTNVAATLVYTVTLASDEITYNVNIQWVNGNKNVLVNYGKFTGPKGLATDYTKCELIDVAAKTAINWKFTGDEAQRVVVY